MEILNLHQFQFDIEVFYRKSSKFEYKKILGWPKIDMCKFVEDAESYPMIKDRLMDLNKMLGGFLHRCPYKNFQLLDATISLHGTEKLEAFIFVNGENKFQIQAYNNRDRNIGFYELVMIQNLVRIK